MKPKINRQELILERINDELVVFDSSTNMAYTLNRTAALVFQMCDGETEVAEMARRLKESLSSEASVGLVQLTLEELSNAGLLAEEPNSKSMTRRRLLSALPVAAASLPVILSLAVPHPAAAASLPTCLSGPVTIAEVCIACGSTCPGTDVKVDLFLFGNKTCAGSPTASNFIVDCDGSTGSVCSDTFASSNSSVRCV